MSYLYERYDFSLFQSRFEDYGRDRQFSDSGLRALYDHLDELAKDTGEPIEVDVIGLCCEWRDFAPGEAEKEYDMTLKELYQHGGMIIEHDEGVLIQIW